MLTLIAARVGKSADGHYLSRYRCDCGGEAVVIQSRVKHGRTQSCGCLSVAVSKAAATHGGRTEAGPRREYAALRAAIQRCHNAKNKNYGEWGGRGIVVCNKWRTDFADFFAHIGPRPSGHSLDRIDNSRGYEPGNVRWATASEQQRNRRNSVWVVYQGGQHPLVEVAKALGITKGAAHLRLKRGKLDGVCHA